jgi:hypothetical protein
MRSSGPLGTLQDFRAGTRVRQEGAIVSCTGLAAEVLDALDMVARAAPDPPKRLVDAAMDAYIRSAAHRSREPQSYQD